MQDLRQELQATLGNAYALEQELRGGGMSRVFVATETALRRKVVVKVLSPELAAGVSANRFDREIRVAASLQQANIVPVLTTGDMDGLPYYTMPFVDGLSLRQRLSQSGPLPITEAVSVLRDVARALAFAHERGVVHRDIKPENVLLSGGAAVVTDFGIAKAVERSRTLPPDAPATESESTTQYTITSVGTALGTPAYMAPEQVAADPAVDHRADIYSFGCLAYELLTGASPFHGRPVREMLVAQMTEQPPPINATRADCPPELARIVMTCLEKNPARRPSSARELVSALDAVTTSGLSAMSLRARPSWRRRAVAATVIVSIAALLYALSGRVRAESPKIPTLAVLPFDTFGGDSTQEYLAEGMADELATALGKVRGVRVVSRTLAHRYKGRHDLDARDVGRALNAGYVVNGSVRRLAGRLRVSAQLTSASDDGELWSESYDRDTKDVFALEDELTRQIVSALRDRFGTGTAAAAGEMQAQQAGTPSRGTANPDAYDLYLRGRYLLDRRTPGVIRQAIADFEQAIAKDSTFARAYAGLSAALEFLPYFGGVPAAEVSARAESAARRALALDSTQSEAYTALALVHQHRFQWEAAGAEHRRAVAADPNDASAHVQLGRWLIYTGELSESIREFERARSIDPVSAIASGWLGRAWQYLGHDSTALAELRRALQLDSLNVVALVAAGEADIAAARREEGRRIADRILRVPPFVGDAAYLYGRLGDTAAAHSILRDLGSRHPPLWMATVSIAYAYLGLGDTTRALDALALATDRGEIWPTYHPLCDYVFDGVRESARFAALARRVGLEPAQYDRQTCRQSSVGSRQ